MLSLLFFAGIASANPWSQLEMRLAWKEEITFDWEELDHATAFVDWQKTFDKTYSTKTEEAERFKIFLENWKFINDHNMDRSNSYTMKLNQFGDLTGAEFAEYVNGPGGVCLKHRSVRDRILMREETPSVEAPDAVDWTDVDGKSYVTAVKNQGNCGSCWAFSVTGSIESAYAIKYDVTGSSIPELSEQELVDCSSSYGNAGCNGGLMDDGFKYVEDSDGLCSETEYPYTAETGTTCKSKQCSKKYDQISGYKDVTHDSESALMAAVAIGPVSVAIQANQRAFQFYSSGVIDGRCGTSLDHGVLVVGYGTDSDLKYWKVKNSWGDSWGEYGYVRICRDCDANDGAGECGILESPSYPLVK